MHSLCVGFIKFLHIIKFIVVSKYAYLLKKSTIFKEQDNLELSISEWIFRLPSSDTLYTTVQTKKSQIAGLRLAKAVIGKMAFHTISLKL